MREEILQVRAGKRERGGGQALDTAVTEQPQVPCRHQGSQVTWVWSLGVDLVGEIAGWPDTGTV